MAIENRNQLMTSASPNFNEGLGLLTFDGEVISLEEAEGRVIEFALERYNGQMSEIARRLGIGRSTLYRKMRYFGLETDEQLND